MAELTSKIEELKLEGAAIEVAAVSQNVTPWEVEGAVVDGVQQAIDYNKLMDQFGTRPIDAALLERFETLTGRQPHIFLRRGTFFSHRFVITDNLSFYMHIKRYSILENLVSSLIVLNKRSPSFYIPVVVLLLLQCI